MESNILQGTHFMLVVSMPGKYRKAFVLTTVFWMLHSFG